MNFNRHHLTRVVLLLAFTFQPLACMVPDHAAILSTSPAETNEMTPISMPDQEAVVVTIDAQSQAQTIEGFGAAGAWWAQDVGGWADAKRTLVADLLFDREKGIGLSAYRYSIGGGNGENIQDVWRRAESFEVARGQYDWTRDANARWMLRAARDRGVEHFVAFVNSPPARMTISGFTTGEMDGKSNLPPDMYGEFSQYLVDVVRRLRDVEGVPIKWLSPINEPQWNWSYQNGQEGCHYGPAEVLELTRVLLRTLRENQLDVQLSLFESGEWKTADTYIEVLAGDPQVWDALPHLSIHSYWSTRADKKRFMAYMQTNHPDKPLWMSEWTEMQEGRDMGMESALTMAVTIHDDLTIADVTSWQYWIAVSKYQYRDGLIYVNPLDQQVLPTKRLWAMGNYSRFIRPGFVRLETQGSDDTVLVSAYRSPDDQRWVVVAVNLANRPVKIKLEALHGQLPVFTTQYETSEHKDMASAEARRGSDVWALSPLSVTTLVMDR